MIICHYQIPGLTWDLRYDEKVIVSDRTISLIFMDYPQSLYYSTVYC